MISVSWSSLRVFEECRAKLNLQWAGKKNPAIDARGYFHGTVVDRVQRRWLEQDDPQPGQMVEWVVEMVERLEKPSDDGVIRWKSASDRADLIEYCKELVTRLEPILFKLVVPFEYQAEMRFASVVNIPGLDGASAPIKLLGGIDIVTRDKRGVYRAFDLKGTRDDSYVRHVLGQAVFYDIAMHSIFGTPPADFVFITPMCTKRLVPVRITDDERRAMLARIVRMAHALMRSEPMLPKKDTQGCVVCDVRHACPKFQPVPGSAHRMAFG